jgi:hypothetical protein
VALEFRGVVFGSEHETDGVGGPAETDACAVGVRRDAVNVGNVSALRHAEF